MAPVSSGKRFSAGTETPDAAALTLMQRSVHLHQLHRRAWWRLKGSPARVVPARSHDVQAVSHRPGPALSALCSECAEAAPVNHLNRVEIVSALNLSGSELPYKNEPPRVTGYAERSTFLTA